MLCQLPQPFRLIQFIRHEKIPIQALKAMSPFIARFYIILVLIVPNLPSQAENADLLLRSNPEGADIEASGYYIVSGNWEKSSHFSVNNTRSIRPLAPGINLEPAPIAMWYPGKEWHDFTLDITFRSYRLTNGETIFRWQGQLENNQLQSIITRIENRRIIWDFHNFFVRNKTETISLTLKSQPLIPKTWNHHRIRYKHPQTATESSGASPGLLEYLIDGIPVDSIHTTKTGLENIQTYTPLIGPFSTKPLIIGEQWAGYLDEMRLTPRYLEALPPSSPTIPSFLQKSLFSAR